MKVKELYEYLKYSNAEDDVIIFDQFEELLYNISLVEDDEQYAVVYLKKGEEYDVL